ncbi:agamous-like MADS-box protein AGL90 [Capsicum chacoense]
MARKLKFSLNLPNTKTGTSRKKRHEELLKRLHEFRKLCRIEIANLSASMQSKNRVAQYEYIEQSIIKMLEEEIVNLIEANLIKELTIEMNKVLKVKEDVAIKMNPYNVNDLAEYTELSIKKLKGESQKQI